MSEFLCQLRRIKLRRTLVGLYLLNQVEKIYPKTDEIEKGVLGIRFLVCA
jgi:hypothetical protein